MKKVVVLSILLCVSAHVCSAQTKKPTQNGKPPAKSDVAAPKQIRSLREVAAADWKILVAAVQAENWDRSASLAREFLTEIKTENDKKQIARLRYILLYTSAAKIASLYLAGKKPEADKAKLELEKPADGFLNEEFFMPSRQIAETCQNRLNYLCGSKQTANSLRVTTTDAAGTAIFSFEYFQLNENFSVRNYDGKQAIVSGVLKKVELNPEKSDLWVMRLFFENGSVSVVPDK